MLDEQLSSSEKTTFGAAFMTRSVIFVLLRIPTA
jgi:hypothetical protein